jgi:hypothetical protein
MHGTGSGTKAGVGSDMPVAIGVPVIEGCIDGYLGGGTGGEDGWTTGGVDATGIRATSGGVSIGG